MVVFILLVVFRTALERIQSFLKEVPVEPYVDEKSLSRLGGRVCLRMNGATFRWSPPSKNTAWAKGQRGGWENIVGYKTIVVFFWQRVKHCFGCGGQKYRLGEAQIQAKASASKAAAPKKDQREIDAEQDGGPPPEVLQGVDLELPQGSLCCIVGKVGSGKSSLLHAILGEMDRVSGTTETNGVISYAAQSACTPPTVSRLRARFAGELTSVGCRQSS